MTPPGPVPPLGGRVFLLRHGETARPDLFHGAESDVDLGERGRAQAAGAAELLRRHAPCAVYCSGMTRARRTADVLAAALGVGDPRIVPALHERRMGALSGRSRDDGWPTYLRARDRWVAGDLDATHDGAESYRMIAARVVPPFLAIARAHPGRAVVVVAHGVVIRVLLTSLLVGASPADWDCFGIDCAALNALDFDGERWTAWHLNGRACAPGPEGR
jgi:broad specificity phosphatase PhoE